jgi:hypothetical protein
MREKSSIDTYFSEYIFCIYCLSDIFNLMEFFFNIDQIKLQTKFACKKLRLFYETILDLDYTKY